jgi:hypothetical protein
MNHSPVAVTSGARPAGQRGATLVVALIMLVALALLAVWAFNSSTANLRIVGNTQVRQEAVAAVQTAIEATISSNQFTLNPAAVAANPIPVDIGGVTYTVTLAPPPAAASAPAIACYRYKVIPTSALDLAAPAFREKTCLGPTQTDFGLDSDTMTGNATDSICASTDWNIRAVVTDAATRANAAINQGVTVRVFTTDAVNACS